MNSEVTLSDDEPSELTALCVMFLASRVDVTDAHALGMRLR
jgi:hypothetical protein